jgi:hypothetical protein
MHSIFHVEVNGEGYAREIHTESATMQRHQDEPL